MQKQCEELKIKLIPKLLVPHLPIKYIRTDQTLHSYDYILIDDDKLIRYSWKTKATEKNKKLISFDSIESFFAHASYLNKDAIVYLDSSLGKDSSGNTVQGEKFIFDIYCMGFQTIFMATGYESDKFEKTKYLAGVVGKTPEFI